MKVLHVITGLDAGGAEHQLRLLLRHLPVQCTVATLTNPGAVARAIKNDGTPVFDMGMRDNLDSSVVPRLARLMAGGGYDIVHTHLYRACVYGRVAARLARVPHVVATEHSLGDTHIEGRPLSVGVRRIYLATERLGDATIAVSGTVARRLTDWGVPAGRIRVIPNGIEATEFHYQHGLRERTRAGLGIAPGSFVVGGVGRMVPGKRFDVLVRAVAELAGATLLLVGDGPEREALVELARTLGVDSRVVFIGESADVHALLCSMDVLAAPSEEETFGMAVLEALASGLPVLYVTCPALDELPSTAAPGARRVPLGVAGFRDGLADLARQARGRLPPPPAVGYHDISLLAGQVAQLYEAVVNPPVITTPVITAPVITTPVTVPVRALSVNPGAHPSEGSTMPTSAKLFRRLPRQGALLTLTILLGVAAGGVYSLLKKPSYAASAYVVVVSQGQSDNPVAVNFAQAYGRIVTQGVVLERAATALGKGTSVSALRQSVQVSTSPDAPLVQVTGSARDPKRAAERTNAVAAALIAYGNERKAQTQVGLAAFAQASPPRTPASPNPPLGIAVGAAAGLLVGGLAVLTRGTGRVRS